MVVVAVLTLLIAMLRVVYVQHPCVSLVTNAIYVEVRLKLTTGFTRVTQYIPQRHSPSRSYRESVHHSKHSGLMLRSP